MISKASLRSGVIVFVVGLLLGPLIAALIAGIATSLHSTHGNVHEPVSPSELDADRLVSAYSDQSGSPWPPTEFREASRALDPGLADCGYQETDWLGKQLSLIDAQMAGKDSQYELLILFTGGRNWFDKYYRYRLAEEVEMRTSGFGRGFLTGCLQSIFYRRLCEPHAASIIKSADRAISAKIHGERSKLAQAGRRMECTYLDGLHARRIGAAFLPARGTDRVIAIDR